MTKLAEILGGNPGSYETSQPVQEYGLDSLSTVELVNWINRFVRVKITPSFVTASTTVDSIFKYMTENM